MNRRHFLGTSAAAAAALAAPAPLHAGRAKPLRVGLVGAGWYGKCSLFRLLQVAPDTQVVALCDVDKAMLADAAKQVGERSGGKSQPKTFHDYREMLKADPFDVVMVETPDHWHALPMIAACEAGADVWVQKPISVDVAEGKAMLDAARKHNRVVQVVTQRRSTPHLAEAKKEFLDSGRLGKIGLVEIYCYYHMRTRENPPDTDPPANLDYDFWTGPAPMRPYNKLVHPRSWRAFTEYGNGIVGDMCIHMFDMVRWMLNLGWPTRVSSSGGIFVDKKSKANITDTQSATFEYPDFDVVWQHRTYGSTPDPKYPWGATFYGDKGTLKASVQSYDFIPQGGKPVHKDVTYELDQYPEDKTEKDLEKHVAPALRAHWKDFLKAREERSKPVADIEQGHISSASCILANLSQQLGRTITWDPQKHVCVGDAEATRRLKRPYRQPWTHPGHDVGGG
ncbi:MAG: Gfo/Idh/MocA family oxidoreductase [Gemmataceae bacterium]